MISPDTVERLYGKKRRQREQPAPIEHELNTGHYGRNSLDIYH